MTFIEKACGEDGVNVQRPVFHQLNSQQSHYVAVWLNAKEERGLKGRGFSHSPISAMTASPLSRRLRVSLQMRVVTPCPCVYG